MITFHAYIYIYIQDFRDKRTGFFDDMSLGNKNMLDELVLKINHISWEVNCLELNGFLSFSLSNSYITSHYMPIIPNIMITVLFFFFFLSIMYTITSPG